MKLFKIITVFSVAAIAVPFVSFAVPFPDSWRWPFSFDYPFESSISTPLPVPEGMEGRDTPFFIPTPPPALEEYAQLDEGDRRKFNRERAKRAEAARAAAEEARRRENQNQSTPLPQVPRPASKPTSPPRRLFFMPTPLSISYTAGFSFPKDTALLDIFEDMKEKEMVTLAPLKTDLTNEYDTYSINGREYTVPADAEERAMLIRNMKNGFNEGVHPLHIDTSKKYTEYARILRNINHSLKKSKEIPPDFFKISDKGSIINFFLYGQNISHFSLEDALSSRGKGEPRVRITNPFGPGGPDQRIPLGSLGSGAHSYAEGEPAGFPSPAHILQGFFVNFEIPFGPTPQRSLIPFDNGHFSRLSFLLNLNHAANIRRGSTLRIDLKANPLIIDFFNDNGDGRTYVPRFYYLSEKAGSSFVQISYDDLVRKMIDFKYLVWKEPRPLGRWFGRKGEYVLDTDLLRD